LIVSARALCVVVPGKHIPRVRRPKPLSYLSMPIGHC